MADQFLPVIIALVVAGVFTAGLLGSAVVLGQRTRQPSRAKTESYESGVPLLDRANKRISVKFYLVALVFVVLDVEVAFLYPWAINYRALGSGGSMYPLWEMLAFLALLAVTYIYLWRKGVFDWGRRRLPAAGTGSAND
jgi:NADH:ubiquinone oxidoreductase subunit 3 (subunit A)